MRFVDRIDETARLKDALARENSSLVVMYGRRRLGKSTLIKRVLSDNDVYFLADRSESGHQRTLLAKVIAQVLPDFDKLTYPDWESMLRAVNYRTDKHFTLCLDEFPYLVEQSPELPSVQQKLVDEKQLKYNLVLCGSSQNVMYGLFMDSTAPLYGRADEIIRLAPIRLPFPEYVSMQWEKLCRDAVTGNLVGGVVYGKAKRWWGSVLNNDKKPEQVEFDVMAESLDKKYLLVGECKWTTQENGRQLIAELLRKANLLPFAKNYIIVPMLFLKNAPMDDVGNVMLPGDVVGMVQ